MFSRSILKMFLVTIFLLATLASATAAAPANEEAQSSVGSIHTYLMPDLSLKSVFSVTALALPSGAGFRKTCRCSAALLRVGRIRIAEAVLAVAPRSSAAAPKEMERCHSPARTNRHAKQSCRPSREAAIERKSL